MSDSGSPDLERLSQVAASATRLYRTSSFSIVLMLAGIAIVGGSAWFSASQLAPLEAKIRDKQKELDDRQSKLITLNRDIARGAKDLEASEKTLEAANKALEAAKAKLLAADKNLQEAERTVQELARRKAELTSQVETLRAEMGRVAANLPNVATPAVTEVRGSLVDLEGTADKIVMAAQTVDPDLDQILADTFGTSPAKRIRAFDQLFVTVQKDPAKMKRVVAFTVDHLDNENGVYNVLVLANSVPKETFEAISGDVKSLLDEVKPFGPKSSKIIKQLASRLPR